ncbi:MAG: hypothetical protein JKY65_34395 [Planctomycetes bacterium]|nr:hypothetical protein [Planctomycetota bacterium]
MIPSLVTPSSLPTDPSLEPGSVARAGGIFVERLRSGRPLIAIELRPPRVDTTRQRSIDSWIDLHHAVRRIVRRDTFVLLTDDAVGLKEEENLEHLRNNLAQAVDPARLVPFLTCKHPIDYCLMHADRALSNGHESLVVLGGDRTGPERCVGHAFELRERVRARIPGLALGGWANPHRDPKAQVDFLEDSRFTGEFFLTQVVSHHDLPAVEAFLKELRARELPISPLFGVFYYRSAKLATLERLAAYLPIPIEGIRRDFESGLKAIEVCAKTVASLRDLGVNQVYLSNLPFRVAPKRLNELEDLLGAPG